MEWMRAHIALTAAVLLFVVNALIWAAVYDASKPAVLTVSFLNIGQGDSVFIQSPTGVQVLVDGGPNATVLRELATQMPWYDRHIDAIIATHPDADHISGLIDVLQRYRVDYIVTNGATKNTGPAESLLKNVANEGAHEVVARRGQVLNLGGGALLTILYPDRDVSNVADTNDGSIVARLTYGDTAFMLTGDAPMEVEDYLVRLDGHHLESTVLKPGHHGSKTSSSLSFVGFVDPLYAVISRGCDNKYGHPHKVTLDTLAQFGVQIFDTCRDGRVVFTSNGKAVTKR